MADMFDTALIKKLDMKSPAVWLATWFGCGLIKGAPGTWGTIGALPFAVLILAFCGKAALLIALILVYWLGYKATAKFEDMSGEHDAGAIVVDEVVGMWLAMMVIPLTPLAVLLAFGLFRLFDILKPWPVSYFDKMDGAKGVMLDDVMAGVYAAICLGGLVRAGII